VKRALPIVLVGGLCLFAGLMVGKRFQPRPTAGHLVDFSQPIRVTPVPPSGTASGGEWRPYSVTTPAGQTVTGEAASSDRVAVFFNGGELVVHAARVTPP
jgi:hypothetical protein